MSSDVVSEGSYRLPFPPPVQVGLVFIIFIGDLVTYLVTARNNNLVKQTNTNNIAVLLKS